MRIKALLLLLSCIALADAAAVSMEELGAAKAKWEAHGVQDYAFEISNVCVCPGPAHTGPLVVVVRKGKVQRAVYAGEPRDGFSHGQNIRRRTPLRVTISELFEQIEKQLRIGNAGYLKIKYDDKGGYPVHFEYADPARQDEQFKILVKNLKRIE